MHQLTGRATDGTDGVNLLRRLGLTFITFRIRGPVDDGDLSEVPGSTGLDEGDGRHEAQAVDTSTGRDIIKAFSTRANVFRKGTLNLVLLQTLP